MKFCAYCGEKLMDIDENCKKCGRVVKVVPQSTIDIKVDIVAKKYIKYIFLVGLPFIYTSFIISSPFMIISNTIVKSFGDYAEIGLNIGNTVINLFSWIGVFFGLGALGACILIKEKNNIAIKRHIIKFSVIVLVSLALLLVIVIYIFIYHIVDIFFSSHHDAMYNAVAYLRLSLLFFIPNILWIFSIYQEHIKNGLIHGLVSSLIGSIISIIMMYAFSLIFMWGVIGIAIGRGIGSLCGLLYMGIMIINDLKKK